jgi:drug/metabolite transporter (DMT)-like permease
LALSIISIALLLFLIRKGEVARSAQLIYLVPPVAALQAYFFFHETLIGLQIAGMMVTSIGVALAVRR